MNPKQGIGVTSISIRDFTYQLPDERIAKFPLERRDASKLLVYQDGMIADRIFSDLPQLLAKGDRLVFNETRVIHARLLFTKPTGGVIEILCLEPHGVSDPAIALAQRGSSEWTAMIGNLKRWKDPVIELNVKGPLEEFRLTAQLTGSANDARVVRFEWDNDYTFAEVIEFAGKLPIPPYLHRDAEASDEERYQTVYARQAGSVAAPTAGLHFTEEVFTELSKKDITHTFVTLHVGAGTFRPVKAETMGGHDMHEERILISRDAIADLLATVTGKRGSRIVAVGTTSLRTLESLYWIGSTLPESTGKEISLGQWQPYESVSGPSPAAALENILKQLDATGSNVLSATTKLLVAPGYRFKLVDALITNFHQPDSTLLLLVAAFVGGDWRKIYDHALSHDYRFLSYGDSSLLIRNTQ